MPVIGLGAKLEVNDGVGDAFAEVADIVNLTVPDKEFGVVESKRLNQSADKTIRKIPTMANPGQFTFQYEFNTTKKSRLDLLLGIEKQWKVTLKSDAGGDWTRTVPGILTANKSDTVEPDAIQMVTCTVEVSGP